MRQVLVVCEWQVIEAMNCGLPTFATIHGGPSEIIVVSLSSDWGAL